MLQQEQPAVATEVTVKYCLAPHDTVSGGCYCQNIFACLLSGSAH